MISAYYLITDYPCRFYVSWSLIDRLPQTRLGRLRRARNTQDILELCDKFNIEDNEYYFDRHPRNFGAVINFYRTGKLHLGEEGCPVAFKQDLDYWGIDELYLEPCCQQRYYQARELIGIDRIERVRVSDVPAWPVMSTCGRWRTPSTSDPAPWAGSRSVCGTCLRSLTPRWAPG